MADQTKSSWPPQDETKKSPESIQLIKNVLPANRTAIVDITAMIRSLQRSEGTNDCFRRGSADCDQLACSWRMYCLGGGDDKKWNSET